MKRYSVGKLPEGMGDTVGICPCSEADYERLKASGALVFCLSFFKDSGKYYTKEHFKIVDTKLTEPFVYREGYKKASYELYSAVCAFAEKGYDGYRGVLAVLEFPAFYPMLFSAERRK